MPLAALSTGKPDLVRVEALGLWEPGEGTRAVAVISPVRHCWEII